MKYNCNMIRDIMPLCADNEAAEESEKALIEHLAECRECSGYWERMSVDLSFEGESGSNAKNYTEIAKKLRVKKNFISIAVGLTVGLVSGAIVFTAGSYTIDGYRSSPEKALVRTQNNLGVLNEKICEYEWNNVKFYFYKNRIYTACYGVEKTWMGWRQNVTYLSDLPENNGEGIVNHMRGTINYGGDDISGETSIEMLPLSVYDDNVVKITLISGGKEYVTDVYSGFTGVLAYERSNSEIPILKGVACDKDGNVLYRLDTSDEYDHKWVKE